MRNKALIIATIILAALVLLSGCSTPAQSFVLGQAPWNDGETSHYAVFAKDGQQTGEATWTWSKNDDGWSQSYQFALSGTLDQGEVAMAGDLTPISSWRELAGQRFAATYGPDSITVETTATDGSVSSKEVKRPENAVDNDASLQIQRALPFAEGYATAYYDVIPTSGQAAAVKVVVDAKESITVPAGTFETWHVLLDFGGGSPHDAWYAVEAPHALIQYRNRASGAEFRLTSLSSAVGGSAVPAATLTAPESPVSTPTRSNAGLNVPFIVTTLAIQIPLMILFPLALGWWLRRRFGLSWGIFGAGMLTFIASQVVHLPLNFALGLIGTPHAVGTWPIVPLAIVAGLSAGICEEVARYIALRFFLKKTRGWRAALQFGAGHGAVEAIILGVIVLFGFVSMLALRAIDPASLGLTGMQADQTQAATAAYWGSAWYMPILAGVERLTALSIHVAMAVLVMRALTRNKIGYLFAAILGHALVDSVAVWASTIVNPIALEAILAGLGVITLLLTLRLREAPQATAAPEPGTEPVVSGPARDTLSPEELAQRIERSKYE